MALLVVVVLTGLVGCGRSGPSIQSGTLTVTDIAARTVEIKAPVQRMLLGESRLLYLTALLDRDDPASRIVAWPNDLRLNDPDTYQQYKAKFPKVETIPEIGSLSSGSFDTEAAISLRPDVVVLTKSQYQNAQDSGVIATFQRVGIPTVVVDFRDKPLETTVPSVELLGTIMGRGQQAKAFVDYYNQQVGLVRARVANLQGQRPTTFLYRAAGLTECCATFGRSNLGDLIEAAGGINLGTVKLPGASGTLSREGVLAEDPDLLIATGADWTNSPSAQDRNRDVDFVALGYDATVQETRAQLATLTRHPGWSQLSSVRDGRFHAVWHQFYGSPYNFVVLQQFAKWQHPQLFADLDPERTFRELHERFLPIPYSGTFWVSLK